LSTYLKKNDSPLAHLDRKPHMHGHQLTLTSWTAKNRRWNFFLKLFYKILAKYCKRNEKIRKERKGKERKGIRSWWNNVNRFYFIAYVRWPLSILIHAGYRMHHRFCSLWFVLEYKRYKRNIDIANTRNTGVRNHECLNSSEL
jgi:hypothetical protein